MALTDNLVSYWKFDEASGSRADSYGSNHLTDNNTVGSAAGIISNAAFFQSGSSEYLSISSNASLEIGSNSAAWTAWARINTVSSFNEIFRKDNEYLIGKSTGSSFRIVVWNASVAKIKSHSTTLVASTWYFVYGEYNQSAQSISISVNNGALETLTSVGTSVDTTTACQLNIGSRAGVDEFWDGEIDEIAYWKGRVLTADERTQLYNNGSGFTWPFWNTLPPFRVLTSTSTARFDDLLENIDVLSRHTHRGYDGDGASVIGIYATGTCPCETVPNAEFQIFAFMPDAVSNWDRVSTCPQYPNGAAMRTNAGVSACGACISWSVALPGQATTGSWALALGYLTGSDSGCMAACLGGSRITLSTGVSTLNFYNATDGSAVGKTFTTASVTASGIYLLKFQMVGQDPSSSGFHSGITHIGFQYV